MQRILITFTLAAALAAAADQSFTGVITDTMCGKTHNMVSGQPDDKCVAACAKGTSAQYALFDGAAVLKLSDQKTAARFSAQRVKVTGTLNQKTHSIKVTAIEPAGAQ